MKEVFKLQQIFICLFLACLLLFTVGCKKDEKEYSLNVNILPVGSGTVDLSPSVSTYPEGFEVTLSPKPASGYKFTAWSGIDASYVNDNKIFISKNIDVIANFEMKTMVRLQSGIGLNKGSQIFFVALSKNVNYFNLSRDEIFAYRKSSADWYIEGDVIPFVTNYKDFELSSGRYYFLVSGTGTVMVTTIDVIPGKQTFSINGTGYGLNVDVLQNNKSALLFEENSRRIINYKH